MKKIYVIATSDRRILTAANVTDIPTLLKENETIEGEWFYGKPDELDKFFETKPDQLDYFLKGFSYWIDAKVKGYIEKKEKYRKLKKTLKKFSETLFKKLRNLANSIANEVKKVIRPQSEMYNEQRKQKQLYRQLTSGPINMHL